LQGTGMGLAIARALVRALGGGIDVISHPHEGTTLTFWIPA
jgi:signal transduction histidine kinase